MHSRLDRPAIGACVWLDSLRNYSTRLGQHTAAIIVGITKSQRSAALRLTQPLQLCCDADWYKTAARAAAAVQPDTGCLGHQPVKVDSERGMDVPAKSVRQCRCNASAVCTKVSACPFASGPTSSDSCCWMPTLTSADALGITRRAKGCWLTRGAWCVDEDR